MKAFLMYRDRDFDPQQLLLQRKRVWLPGRQSRPAARAGPAVERRRLTQDLGMDILFNAMARGDNFLLEVAKVAILSGVMDRETILYRQRILLDCLKNRRIAMDIYRIALEAIEGERKNYLGFLTRYPGAILHRAVEVLQIFVVRLKKLRAIADWNCRQIRIGWVSAAVRNAEE